jgi:hypothetical protein
MPTLINRDFVINARPQGTFKPSGKYQTRPEDIEHIIANWRRDQRKHIALYFHGGLVGEKAGLESAENIAPLLEEAGCAPACFVWETGLLETIGTNLVKIRETKLFDKLLKIVLRRASEHLPGIDIIGKSTGAAGLTKEQIESELLNPKPFENLSTDNQVQFGKSAGRPEHELPNEIIFEAELRDELQRDFESDFTFTPILMEANVSGIAIETGGKNIIDFFSLAGKCAKLIYRIVKRFYTHRDHGFFSTVIEELLREFYIAELGAWVWKGMKDKSSEIWESNQNLEGLNQKAGRYLLDLLIDFKRTNPDTKISLIGHSAGSIAICHLIETTAQIAPEIVWDNVIFMAPACLIDLFKNTILDHPARVRNIRMFTMTDENESNDALVPYVYTRSLLYLISGILEDNGKSFDAYILGLERHFRNLPPYNIPELSGCHDYLFTNGLQRTCLSVSSPGTPGLATSALKHGHFDDDEETLKSIQHILQQ